jgi:hypothetical protein
MAAIHAISKGRLRMQLHEVAGNAVAVYPAFRNVLGLSGNAAQFLSQAVYWTERTADGWFYKTEGEWKGEIGLSPKEVRSSRKSLSALALLEEVRKGVPAKIYYRVNTDLLISYLENPDSIPAIEQAPKGKDLISPKGTTSPTQKVELVLLEGEELSCPNGTTITETTQETTAETTSLALLPAVAAKKRQPKPNVETEQARQEACRAIWGSYARAYINRYGAAPVRNGKVNRQVIDLLKRLGAEAAPVAEFYVSINDSYLIRNCHDLGSLLTKAESYRTQWATGRQMNGRTARQLEDTQANINAAQEAGRRLQGKGARNEFL